MSYGVAGSSPFADAPDKEDLVLALFNNKTNWTEDEPAHREIEFGTNWEIKGIGASYGIYVTDPFERPTDERTTDWRMQGYNTTVSIHAFAKRTDTQKPAQMGNMIRMINKIRSNKRQLLGYGLRALTPISWRNAADNGKDFWHSIGETTIIFLMVDTS